MKHARRAHLHAALLTAALLIGLLAFAFLGSHTRYMADDFCQAAETHKHGFVQSQLRWYRNWTGRFASNFSIAAATSVGPAAAAILPAFLLALWLAGAAWAAQLFSLFARRPVPILYTFLLAALVFATVNGAHDIAQSLYWQAGLLTYVAPLALMPFNLGLILLAVRRRLGGQGYRLAAALAAVLALVACGFSESFSLMQIGGFALVALACYRYRSAPVARAALGPVVISLAGSLLALCVIVLAPGNESRQGYFSQPPGLFRLAGLTLFYSAAFIPYTIYLSPLNSIMSVTLPAWVASRVAADGGGVKLSPHRSRGGSHSPPPPASS